MTRRSTGGHRGSCVCCAIPCMGLLVTTLLSPSVAQATQPPTCLGMPPTNNPTPGDDVIAGTLGDDVLAGGAGDDDILGIDGNDTLCGGEGNDRIAGGAGMIDLIDGGPGDDVLAGGLLITASPPCGPVEGFGGEPFPPGTPAGNRIFGGPGNDSILGAGAGDGLHGGAGDDCLMGLDGRDYLNGNDGADRVFAGDGDDTALGGNDYDRLDGEEGNDSLFAATAAVQVPEFPDSCSQSGELADVSGPMESGAETIGPGMNVSPENELHGDDGYDRLVGSNRNDVMLGGRRGDDLYGFAGNDRQFGQEASDCLSGGPGSDQLDDADPNSVMPDDIDILWGGADPDIMIASDGDGLDQLDGGSHFNVCVRDFGDTIFRCFAL